MSKTRDALLKAFVESEASPDGKWWIDVPVGLSVGDGDSALLDAVCLTSREQELPEVYPEHTGVPCHHLTSRARSAEFLSAEGRVIGTV